MKSFCVCSFVHSRVSVYKYFPFGRWSAYARYVVQNIFLAATTMCDVQWIYIVAYFISHVLSFMKHTFASTVSFRRRHTSPIRRVLPHKHTHRVSVERIHFVFLQRLYSQVHVILACRLLASIHVAHAWHRVGGRL